LVAVAYEQSGMKINSEKIEVRYVFKNPSTLQVSGNKLQEAERFKCLVVVFTSGGMRNKNDARFDKANAVYYSVVTKWELSNIAKMSVFRSVSRSTPMYLKVSTCCSVWWDLRGGQTSVS